MIPGLIGGVEVEGTRYVVQTEDRGPQRRELVTSAFLGGVLVYRRTVGYSDLAGLDLEDHGEVLAGALRQLHVDALRDVRALHGERGPVLG